MGPIRNILPSLVIPKQLEKQVVEWYHNALYYPGETHTELSISEHFYWETLST